MGGEGHISAMITSLKNNRRRGIKKSKFDKSKDFQKIDTSRELKDFPKLPVEQMVAYKQKLKKRKIKSDIKTIVLPLFITAVIFLVVYFLIIS